MCGSWGGHGLVDDHRAAWPGLGAGGDEQVCVRPHTDDGEHEVDIPTEKLVVRTGSVDVQRRTSAKGARDGGDGRARVHLDGMFAELGVDECAECRVDGGENLGQHLDLGDLQSASSESFGHLEPDVSGADDQRG